MIEATLELLADPDAQDRIRRSQAEVTEGDVLDEAAVRALLTSKLSADK